MPKTIATVFLAIIGLLALCYVGWRTAIHATAQEGFWFSYYCGEWPVTLSETDLDHDRKISRQEARPRAKAGSNDERSMAEDVLSTWSQRPAWPLTPLAE